jgi:hypothetical protein
MSIPHKITKRQFTALNKKNMKYLKGMIADANNDYLIEADAAWNVNSELHNGIHHVRNLNEAIDTVNSYAKELRAAFRDYAKDKIRIQKAYNRGCK